MLDLLIYVTKGLSCVTTKLREEGKEIGKDVNHLVTVNLFTTITNANFDRDAIVARIKETLKVKEDLRSKLTDLDSLPEAALWNGSESEFDAKADSDAVGVLSTELCSPHFTSLYQPTKPYFSETTWISKFYNSTQIFASAVPIGLTCGLNGLKHQKRDVLLCAFLKIRIQPRELILFQILCYIRIDVQRG